MMGSLRTIETVLLLGVVLMANSRATGLGQEKPPEKPEAKAKEQPAAEKKGTSAPATVKVEKGPFRAEVTVTGVFESTRMSEVSIRPKAWTMPLVVESAVELGTPVKTGRHPGRDRSREDRQGHRGRRGREHDWASWPSSTPRKSCPCSRKLLPIDLTAAERAKTQADEDLKRFVEIDRPKLGKNGSILGQDPRRVPGICQGGTPPAREDVSLQGPDRGDRGDHPPPHAVPGRVERVPLKEAELRRDRP